MKLTFAPKGILQIDDARIIWPNFSGRPDKFNKDGERNFTLVIPDPKIAEALQNDTNELGAAWNVKVRAPREEGEAPFITMAVKVKFNGRGPVVHLISGDRRVRLTEETIGCLDNMDIRSIDMDIRPFDGEGNFGPFRAAYLHSMEVVQEIDRFSARYASEEFPEE